MRPACDAKVSRRVVVEDEVEVFERVRGIGALVPDREDGYIWPVDAWAARMIEDGGDPYLDEVEARRSKLSEKLQTLDVQISNGFYRKDKIANNENIDFDDARSLSLIHI